MTTIKKYGGKHCCEVGAMKNIVTLPKVIKMLNPLGQWWLVQKPTQCKKYTCKTGNA